MFTPDTLALLSRLDPKDRAIFLWGVHAAAVVESVRVSDGEAARAGIAAADALSVVVHGNYVDDATMKALFDRRSEENWR